jgi:hypothetical protein
MIVVYPMLVSNAVTQNIIPGICKMVENYLIVYSMDDVLGNIKKQRKVNYKIRGKKLFQEGDYSPVVVEADEDDEDVFYTKGTKGKSEEEQEKGKQDEDEGVEEKEKKRKKKYNQKKLDDAKDSRTSVSAGDMKTITLQPSYIEIKLADGRTDFIGVKVVPINVKSDAKLSHMIANDLSLGFIRSSLVGLGRKILRWAYLKLGSKKIDIPTGDPRKDMFMARTGLQGNAFIALDKNEDIDQILFSRPKKVAKLFSLSWGNIIMADDINRKAYFCMQKFKGICSMIPYSMLYQTLGQKQVYDDLEDARQKSGTIFKKKKVRLKGLVSEQFAQIKLSAYQTLREDSKNGKNR